MIRLLVCHRKKKELSLFAMQKHWLKERRQLIEDSRESLGFVRYGQIHQLPRRNLIYRIIRFTRSWIVANIFADKLNIELESDPPDRNALREEYWDIVESFWFKDFESLHKSLADDESDFKNLERDSANWTRTTILLATKERLVTADPSYRRKRITILFFLRTYKSLGRARMQRYWWNSHRKLVSKLSLSLGFTAYDQLHVPRKDVTECDLSVERESGEDFDAVASLTYKSQLSLFLGFLNPRTQIANGKLIKDEIRFIDAGRSVLIFGKEYLS